MGAPNKKTKFEQKMYRLVELQIPDTMVKMQGVSR